jgi:hypothetical protein
MKAATSTSALAATAAEAKAMDELEKTGVTGLVLLAFSSHLALALKQLSVRASDSVF